MGLGHCVLPPPPACAGRAARRCWSRCAAARCPHAWRFVARRDAGQKAACARRETGRRMGRVRAWPVEGQLAGESGQAVPGPESGRTFERRNGLGEKVSPAPLQGWTSRAERGAEQRLANRRLGFNHKFNVHTAPGHSLGPQGRFMCRMRSLKRSHILTALLCFRLSRELPSPDKSATGGAAAPKVAGSGDSTASGGTGGGAINQVYRIPDVGCRCRRWSPPASPPRH